MQKPDYTVGHFRIAQQGRCTYDKLRMAGGPCTASRLSFLSWIQYFEINCFCERSISLSGGLNRAQPVGIINGAYSSLSMLRPPSREAVLRRLCVEKLENLRLVVSSNYILSASVRSHGHKEAICTNAAIVPVHNEWPLQD